MNIDDCACHVHSCTKYSITKFFCPGPVPSKEGGGGCFLALESARRCDGFVCRFSYKRASFHGLGQMSVSKKLGKILR